MLLHLSATVSSQVDYWVTLWSLLADGYSLSYCFVVVKRCHDQGKLEAFMWDLISIRQIVCNHHGKNKVAGRPDTGVITESLYLIFKWKAEKEIGFGMGFWNFKAQTQWHTSSNKVTLANLTQSVVLAENQTFKCICLSKPFSFKPPQLLHVLKETSSNMWESISVKQILWD